MRRYLEVTLDEGLATKKAERQLAHLSAPLAETLPIRALRLGEEIDKAIEQGRHQTRSSARWFFAGSALIATLGVTGAMTTYYWFFDPPKSEIGGMLMGFGFAIGVGVLGLIGLDCIIGRTMFSLRSYQIRAFAEKRIEDALTKLELRADE